MENVVMGNLDGNIERLAFETHDIERIIPRYGANLVYSANGPDLQLELNGKIYSVQGEVKKEAVRPYFIALKSGLAFNSIDYQILFNVEELPDNIVSGISVNGQKHLCKIYKKIGAEKLTEAEKALLSEKCDADAFTLNDTEQLKEMIQKMKKNEFFELLTMELSDKLKGVAKELIDFRKDIQSKIEPDIVEIASKDIPEASNQLECINETLEESTMKIMDINEEQTELAASRIKMLTSILVKAETGETGINHEDAAGALRQQIDVLKMIETLSLKMMEPLSFQDLVGQRIQRIIKLVRSMENRIEELIVSFGIKLKKHKEDPARSYEELNVDVDRYMMELKGPQRSGEGLNQGAIDDLLMNL
jgi:chemotaxis regulatin CheY-phosphate phosphatase CheZ